MDEKTSKGMIMTKFSKRRLKITYITDSRFDKYPLKKIKSLERKLISKQKLGFKIVHKTSRRKLFWKDKTFQFRRTFYIKIDQEKLTWNKFYEINNKIQAVPYSFA